MEALMGMMGGGGMPSSSQSKTSSNANQATNGGISINYGASDGSGFDNKKLAIMAAVMFAFLMMARK